MEMLLLLGSAGIRREPMLTSRSYERNCLGNDSIADVVGLCGRQVMNEDLRDYLELASSTKYDILTTGWAGLGLGVVSTSTRLTGYWLLVGIILALGIATANYEDFPASVTKPTSVCILDIVAHVTEFLLEVGHASTPNCCTRMFQFLSLVGGFGWRIGRGFLISRDVPNTPITSRCDWFNTFGLAMLHGVKWAFGLMAWPATAIALTGPDEPFVLVKDTGKWLTREERRALLAVVLSSE